MCTSQRKQTPGNQARTRRSRSILLLAPLVLAAAPVAYELGELGELGPYSSPALSLNLAGSYWQTEGFGYVLEICPNHSFNLYEVTPPLGSIPLLGGTLVRKSEGQVDLVSGEDNAFADEGEVIGTLRPGDGRLLLRRPGTLDDILCERLDGRPGILDQGPDSSPPGVFDYFCRVFESHHAFLQERIDKIAVRGGVVPPGSTWADLCETAAQSVTPSTTREELCGILSKLLFYLGDTHTFLEDPRGNACEFSGWHPLTFATIDPGVSPYDVDEDAVDELIEEAFRLIDFGYLDQGTGVRAIANDEIYYGKVALAPVLYLRILSFSDYARAGNFNVELESLRMGLDQVATFYKKHALKAVVIDLRYNGGGHDALGIEIASRFNRAPYPAYVEVVRNDPDVPDSYAEPQTHWVPATKSPGMRDAPVALLTGRLSISAAETFTMAMMERQDLERPVIRVGEPTQGVFSDVHIRVLPNLMVVGLPNERYLTSLGEDFEIDGIAPDIFVPVFAPADVSLNRDPALERAIDELARWF